MSNPWQQQAVPPQQSYQQQQPSASIWQAPPPQQQQQQQHNQQQQPQPVQHQQHAPQAQAQSVWQAAPQHHQQQPMQPMQTSSSPMMQSHQQQPTHQPQHAQQQQPHAQMQVQPQPQSGWQQTPQQPQQQQQPPQHQQQQPPQHQQQQRARPPAGQQSGYPPQQQQQSKPTPAAPASSSFGGANGNRPPSAPPAPTPAASSPTIAATPAQLAALTAQINSMPPGHPWAVPPGSSSSAASEPAPSTLFGNDQFSEEESARIQLLLERKLANEEMATRSGGGKAKLYYVEAHAAINYANYIFDYNGWSSSIKEFTMDYLEDKGGRWFVGLSCIVRIMLKDGTYHEDVGYGSCANMPDRGAALEKAKKEAASDALKRALRLFGNGLGNCIYDKEYLAKLGKGQIVAQPLDLSLNRPKKRQRFMPLTKEEIRIQDQQQQHQQQQHHAVHSQQQVAAPPSPGLNKPHAYAAAHNHHATPTPAPSSNPYVKQQPPQQQQPSPQHQPPRSYQQQQPPQQQSHYQQQPQQAAPAAQSPQQPAQQWNSPVVKSELASPVIRAPAPAPTPTGNPWQPTTGLPQLQSSYAQQVHLAPPQPAMHQPQPQQQQQPAHHQPSAMHPAHPQQHANANPHHHTQQQMARPVTASTPMHAHTTTHAPMPAPAPAPAQSAYTPPSSFTAGLVAAAPAPPSAYSFRESKVDDDLDDDLLLQVAEHHSPQKPKETFTPPATAPGKTASTASRQLMMPADQQKENKPPSLHCSPVPTAQHNSQPMRTSQQQQPAVPTKSPIFSVADLLEDHEQANL